MTLRRLLVIGILLRAVVGLAGDVVECKVQTKAQGIPEFTLLLQVPDAGPAKGVVCLSLLGSSVAELKFRLEEKKAYRPLALWAQQRQYAIIAWGARSIWDPHRNWNEQEKRVFRTQDARFDELAMAWDRGVQTLAKRYDLPTSGYLMYGISAAGQFALRLALRKPERFLAVHAHVPSSFDKPTAAGRNVLWCVTTGENEAGYARSRAFFDEARNCGYSLIYKAYPGLGHTGTPLADALGLACFDYAVSEREKAAAAKGGAARQPDWQTLFSQAPYVADVVNQLVAKRENESRLPKAFRLPLPSGELVSAWRREE